MEEGNKVNIGNGGGKNEGRPPKPLAAVCHQCLNSGNQLTTASCKKSLVRHPSLVKTRTLEISVEELSMNDCKVEFVPILRSGACSDIGARSAMEDVLVCADNFVHDYGLRNDNQVPSAFYGKGPSLEKLKLYPDPWPSQIDVVSGIVQGVSWEIYLKSGKNKYSKMQAFDFGDDNPLTVDHIDLV